MPTLRKAVILLVLSVFLAAPGSSAAGRQPANPKPATESLAVQALLGRGWAFFTSLWTKTGCSIDPDGRGTNAPIPAPIPEDQADTGCGIDPNGRCGS